MRKTRLFYREMDCPVQWSLVTPLGLGESVQSQPGLSKSANPICKCRCHKAGHLRVRVAAGRRSTCVLKEAPLDKGSLGLSQLKTTFDMTTLILVPAGAPRTLSIPFKRGPWYPLKVASDRKPFQRSRH